MACSILGPWQSHVQHWLVNLLVGWVLQPLRLPPLPGLASSGVRMLLDVCCCMATPSIQSSGMWASSENTTQRLLLKFQPYGQNVWADYIQCLGCIELRSLQCCDIQQTLNGVQAVIAQDLSAFLAVTVKNMKMLKLNLFSISTSSLRVYWQWNFKGGKLL